MKLSTLMHKFFDQYLTKIKGVAYHTINTYRDTFTLFLPFAAQYHSIKITSLNVNHISSDLILAFLNYLETDRKNTSKTRNQRLTTLKSFAKMIRLIHPEHCDIAQMILNIPEKRSQKKLIGFFSQEEMLNILTSVDIRKKEGFRDYAILHLLFDSGARASEIAALSINNLDLENKTLAFNGKGNKLRQITLWAKTTQLLKNYITQYRTTPKPLFQHRLFINQRGEELTRHGINRICKKYITKNISPKLLKNINPAHSFRHSCAVNMLASGYSITDIKNHLGHDNIQSTMIYLKLNLTRKREVQKKFIQYTQTLLSSDPKIDELIDWENKNETLTWLDSL